jgi:hypothetical protein
MAYFLRVNKTGKVIQGLSNSDLQQMAKSQLLCGEDEIRKDGHRTWHKVNTVKGLKEYLSGELKGDGDDDKEDECYDYLTEVDCKPEEVQESVPDSSDEKDAPPTILTNKEIEGLLESYEPAVEEMHESCLLAVEELVEHKTKIIWALTFGLVAAIISVLFHAASEHWGSGDKVSEEGSLLTALGEPIANYRMTRTVPSVVDPGLSHASGSSAVVAAGLSGYGLYNLARSNKKNLTIFQKYELLVQTLDEFFALVTALPPNIEDSLHERVLALASVYADVFCELSECYSSKHGVQIADWSGFSIIHPLKLISRAWIACDDELKEHAEALTTTWCRFVYLGESKKEVTEGFFKKIRIKIGHRVQWLLGFPRKVSGIEYMKNLSEWFVVLLPNTKPSSFDDKYLHFLRSDHSLTARTYCAKYLKTLPNKFLICIIAMGLFLPFWFGLTDSTDLLVLIVLTISIVVVSMAFLFFFYVNLGMLKACRQTEYALMYRTFFILTIPILYLWPCFLIAWTCCIARNFNKWMTGVVASSDAEKTIENICSELNMLPTVEREKLWFKSISAPIDIGLGKEDRKLTRREKNIAKIKWGQHSRKHNLGNESDREREQ